MMRLCAAIILTQLASLNCHAIITNGDQEVIGLESTKSTSRVRHALKKADIIPTVIDDFTPGFLLNITWSAKSIAILGNQLKPKKLHHAPSVSLYSPSSSLTPFELSVLNSPNLIITLTDPDAPSRKDPRWSEICHWIARGVPVNITDLSTQGGDKCNKEPEDWVPDPDVGATLKLTDLVSYLPPGPPPKTGKHRYIFLAFAPLNATSEPLALSKPGDRKHWGAKGPGHGVREWAESNGLGPIAANFVYAKNKKQ